MNLKKLCTVAIMVLGITTTANASVDYKLIDSNNQGLFLYKGHYSSGESVCKLVLKKDSEFGQTATLWPQDKTVSFRINTPRNIRVGLGISAEYQLDDKNKKKAKAGWLSNEEKVGLSFEEARQKQKDIVLESYQEFIGDLSKGKEVTISRIETEAISSFYYKKFLKPNGVSLDPSKFQTPITIGLNRFSELLKKGENCE